MSRERPLPRETFSELRDILARFYPDPGSIQRIIEDAGLDSSRIVFMWSAVNNWHQVLTEAERSGKIESLFNVVLNEYGNNSRLQHAIALYVASEPTSRASELPSHQALQPYPHSIWILILTISSVTILSALLYYGLRSFPSIPNPTPRPTVTAHAVSASTPTSTPLPPTGVQKRVSEAVDRLAKGQILFNPPDEMTAGETYEIVTRIIQSMADEAREKLEADLVGIVDTPQIETIRVSSEMKVELTSAEGDFNITSLSEPQQAIGRSDYSEWKWQVTPLRRGTKKLFLKVSAIIEIPGLTQKTKSIPVLEKEINVKVNYAYSTRAFLALYWYILLAMIIVPPAGWYWVKYKRIPESVTNINTEGGPFIGGSVDSGGDFVGRDKTDYKD